RVILELAPEFAPEHFKNIVKLAQNRYWDGLHILRVQDNYVVQWGFHGEKTTPALEKKMKGVDRRIKDEFEASYTDNTPFFKLSDPDTYAPQTGFSYGFPVGRDPSQKKHWLTHCYGIVGISRGSERDSASAEGMYVVIGQSPRHLDRNITLVGRVVFGMELLSTLPRGKKEMGFYKNKKSFVPIRSLHLMSEVPKNKWTKIEILKTDSTTFAQWVESRRNRREKWFYRPAGAIEICNLNPPTRLY
ncbi:MAG: peptidylprolyl isomerase, partial [Pseudomonadota bacterium]